MNFTRRALIINGVVLTALATLTLSGRAAWAEVTAPEISTGEYTVRWTEPSSDDVELYLLESGSLTERHLVTGTSSKTFCRPDGHYIYQLELCTDELPRGRECVPLPGKAEVTVSRFFPDEWYKRVRRGPTFSEIGRHAVQADDGNFVVLCGNVFGPFDIYLKKISRCGEKIWERTHALESDVRVRALLRTQDGGYLIVGRAGGELLLFRTNRAGRRVTHDTLPIGTSATGWSAVQISDDRYVVTGSASIPGSGVQGILAKVRQVGAGFDVEWQREFGSDDMDDRAYHVVQTQDGGYAVAGSTKNRKGKSYAWLVKFNAQGGQQWNERYDGKEDTYGEGVVQRANGDFVLVGSTNYLIPVDSVNLIGSQIYVVVAGPDGQELGKEYFGDGEDRGVAIQRNPGGGFVIAGTDDDAALLLHIDESGSQELDWHDVPVGYLSNVHSLEPTATMGWIVGGSGYFEDNASPHDMTDAFLLYYKPGEWSAAYRGLFEDPRKISLFRVYRDRVLRSTPEGRKLIDEIYANSQPALITLLRHPQLMSRAARLLEANRSAVEDVLRGRPGLVEDPDAIVSFLGSFAEKGEGETSALAKRISEMILEHRRDKKVLFGFMLSPPAWSGREQPEQRHLQENE